MIDDISSSIRSHYQNRATSPLIKTFVIMWAIWNYKLLFTLFSGMPVHYKFDYIENYIYTSEWVMFSNGLLYPLLTALLFIFIYPWPARFVYEYTHRRERELTTIKKKIEDETPLTIEGSRKIIGKVLQLEKEIHTKLAKKEREIERLTELVHKLQSDNPSPKLPVDESINKVAGPAKVIKKLVVEVDENQFNLLKMIADNKGWVTEDNLFNQSTFNQIRTEYYLVDLENKGYVKRYYDHDTMKDSCELTERSRHLLLESEESEKI